MFMMILFGCAILALVVGLFAVSCKTSLDCAQTALKIELEEAHAEQARIEQAERDKFKNTDWRACQ